MATKIRLQRGGRKGYAFYSIVVADVRAPRDGKFTEKIGTYNPNTNPATVDLVKGLDALRENEAKAKKEAYAKNLEAEKKMNEAIAKKVAEKKAAEAAAEAPAEEAASDAAKEAAAEA